MIIGLIIIPVELIIICFFRNINNEIYQATKAKTLPKFFVEYRHGYIVPIENLDEWQPVREWGAENGDDRGLGQYLDLLCQSNKDKYPVFTLSLENKQYRKNGLTKWNKTLEEWSKEKGIFHLLFDQ